MKLFFVTVVRALDGRQRVHTSKDVMVHCKDEAEATELAKQHVPGWIFVTRPREAQAVYTTHYGTVSSAALRKMMGRADPPKKEPPAPKLSSRPLGETQRDCLRSLASHGKWPGGWVWDNYSRTKRIFEILRQRCLVDEKSGSYTINDNGRKALET